MLLIENDHGRPTRHQIDHTGSAFYYPSIARRLEQRYETSRALHFFLYQINLDLLYPDVILLRARSNSI